MKIKNHVKTAPRSGLLAAGTVVLILLSAAGCRFGIPDYTLTVIVEEGVAGTPEAGQYVYQELTTVEFAYLPVNALHTVEVFINGTMRSIGTGGLVMYADGYEIKARLMDVRGAWKFNLNYDDTTIPDIGDFIITFAGDDLTGGTFSDSRGFNGTWTAVSNAVTLTYSDWVDYVLSGTLFSMVGTFNGEGLTGGWSAARQE